jgi:ribonuclease BN (tRNA processing enzyme)
MTLEVVILGSGTAVATATRGAASYLICQADQLWLWDCGPGATRKLAQAGYQINDLDVVLVSHFHADHVCDLTAILFAAQIPGFARQKPLRLIGPQGLQAHYAGLVQVYGRSVMAQGFDLQIQELAVGQQPIINQWTLADTKLVARPMAHSFPAVGYRLETPTTTLVYSGDTDYCDNIVELCREADLAILDCSTPHFAKIPGHLSARLAGQVATQAAVRHLVLSHFYPIGEQTTIAEECRQSYTGKLTLAEDMMRFTFT